MNLGEDTKCLTSADEYYNTVAPQSGASTVENEKVTIATATIITTTVVITLIIIIFVMRRLKDKKSEPAANPSLLSTPPVTFGENKPEFATRVESIQMSPISPPTAEGQTFEQNNREGHSVM